MAPKNPESCRFSAPRRCACSPKLWVTMAVAPDLQDQSRLVGPGATQGVDCEAPGNKKNMGLQ